MSRGSGGPGAGHEQEVQRPGASSEEKRWSSSGEMTRCAVPGARSMPSPRYHSIYTEAAAATRAARSGYVSARRLVGGMQNGARETGICAASDVSRLRRCSLPVPYIERLIYSLPARQRVYSR